MPFNLGPLRIAKVLHCSLTVDKHIFQNNKSIKPATLAPLRRSAERHDRHTSNHALSEQDDGIDTVEEEPAADELADTEKEYAVDIWTFLSSNHQSILYMRINNCHIVLHDMSNPN